MGRHAGEDVVQIGVGDDHQDQGQDGVPGLEQGSLRREELKDQAAVRDGSGKGEKTAEPEEGLPGRGLFRKIFLRQHSCHQKQAHRRECRSHSAGAMPARGGPGQGKEYEDSGKNPFITTHGPQGGELPAGKLAGFRCRPDFRRIGPVDHGRNQEKRAESRNRGCLEPRAPVDDHAGRVHGQLSRQRIGGHGGQEQGAGHNVRLEGGKEQISAKAASALTRTRIKFENQTPGNWINDTSCAGRIGGCHRCQREIGKSESVAQTQGTGTEFPDQDERDSSSQAGLGEAAGENESHYDDPGDSR